MEELGGAERYQQDLGDGGAPFLLRDHATAEYWRLAAKAAHALPRRYPGRRFLLDAVETDVATASRKHGISQDAGNRRWWRLLERAGLPREKREPAPQVARPAPVRRFTARERRELQATLKSPRGRPS